MGAGLNRAQAHTSSMFGVRVFSRVCITGNWATRSEEGQCLNHSSHFSGVVRVSPGTREGRMSLGGDTLPQNIYADLIPGKEKL